MKFTATFSSKSSCRQTNSGQSSRLTPQNQVESLLVEKIAVDFWRLRRVVRFEGGSIAKYLDELLEKFYSFGKKRNEELDRDIAYNKRCFEWNTTYISCLQKEEVSFDQPLWSGNGLESDILEDFYLIAKNIEDLSRSQRELLASSSLSLNELRELLKKHGYFTKQEIATRLIELYERQNTRLATEIKEQEQKKLENSAADDLTRMLALIPSEANSEKIMKYERSLQKSIFQNLFMLKKLQGSF